MAVELFEMLKRDHEEVRAIIRKLLQTEEGEERPREDGLTRLKDGLLPHMRAEEQAYYPVLKRREATRQMAEEALQEHHEAERVLVQLDNLAASDNKWLRTLEELQQKLEHHIREEEGKIFPKSEQELDSAQLGEILQQVMTVKEEMQSALAR